MLAEVALCDGDPVTINMDQIDYIEQAGTGTLMIFADGPTLALHESYDAVGEVMDRAQQAGC